MYHIDTGHEVALLVLRERPTRLVDAFIRKRVHALKRPLSPVAPRGDMSPYALHDSVLVRLA
jgi:hypothetical protein